MYHNLLLKCEAEAGVWRQGADGGGNRHGEVQDPLGGIRQAEPTMKNQDRGRVCSAQKSSRILRI